MERQKTHTSQHSIEGEEHSWRTDATQVQDLLKIYGSQDNVVLAKE